MDIEELKQKYNYNQATPAIKQYLEAKFANPDCIVLFRMGDFYEIFFDDAVLVSNLLGLALSRRGKIGDDNIDMCGVPYHAVDSYVHKLIEDGFKIAICDQLETPEEAKERGGYKAVVKREVVRIITSGTIIEENLLSLNQPNYLSAIVYAQGKIAICYVDLSISEIFVTNIGEDNFVNEIVKIAPKEILLSENLRESKITEILKRLNCQITYQVESFFALNKNIKIIQDFYKIHDYRAIAELSPLEICAIGCIIEYLSLTQKRHLPLLPLPRIMNSEHFMVIDSSTRHNLELVKNMSGGKKGSLLSIIDCTITKAGSRKLYDFLSNPLIDKQLIEKRLNLTEFFFKNEDLCKKIRELLKHISDLKRSLTKINMQKSIPKDLLNIRYSLEIGLKIKEEILNYSNISQSSYNFIFDILNDMKINDHILSTIKESIREDSPNSLHEGGFIKDSYHEKIAHLNELIDNSKSYIEKLKSSYIKETGIDNLKILHNNILGLFIEVTSRNAAKINQDKFIHRQTTVNNVRYTTSELKELESEIINAKVLAQNLEKEIYNEVCNSVIQYNSELVALADSLSLLDVFTNFAYIAHNLNYVKPEITSDYSFTIVKARHPVIEKNFVNTGQSFVTNDCMLETGKNLWLLTGANMAGKSTFLRQNALIAIMAQIGCFVPAQQAKIGVIDRIFSRVGAGDDLLKGHSTFMLEMLETSAILAQASKKSLIILDEVGRGTSTYDGVAIAWSVLEYIHNNIGARCLFATHYHELTDLENSLANLKNYTLATKIVEGDILFLHSVIEGFADHSYGIFVARLAGLPAPLIERAQELLKLFESSHSVNYINNLEQK